MLSLIVRRLIQLPLILLAVYTLTFTLAWWIPGNPLERGEGRRPPEEIERIMLEQYNLDSYWSFYWDYLGKATSVSWLLGRSDRPFDLGPSLRHENHSVNGILASGLPISATLGAAALLLACVIGVAVGAVGGAKPGSLVDALTLLVALIGVSLPTFVVGAALLVVFAFHLGWFPVGGWGDLQQLILPAVTLSLPFAAYIARLTRFGMVDQLSSEYVRAARAKGLPERTIILKHALKNAFLPVLSYLGPAAAMAMTGSFVVEQIFAVPGVGTHFVDAVLAKDLTMIMGIVLTYATMLVLFNLIVDVLYRWIDPRIEM
jgi:oligopeptide transport system permease protein